MESPKYCMNSGRIYKCGTVAVSSIPLLDYLCSTPRNFSRPAWNRRILRSSIAVNGSIVADPEYLLTQGCQVAYHRPPWNEPVLLRGVRSCSCDGTTAYDPHALTILYQDDHIMAVAKPSGLPTMHSQTFYEYTVLTILRKELRCLAPPQPVHRLGVGTSGVLLLALSLPARKSLSMAIREHRVRKIYRALVTHADTLPDSLRIDCPIGPVPFPIGGDTIYAACPNNNNSEKRSTEGKKVKESLSFVRVVRRNPDTNTAVVDVEIPTGRPHQIRIHMAYAGHPLVNDPLYRLVGGIPDPTPRLFPKRQKEEEDMDTDDDDDDEAESVLRVALPRDCEYSLHAHRITVEHPVTGESLAFTAPPPEHLA